MPRLPPANDLRIIDAMRVRWVLAGASALCYLIARPLDFVIERASDWYAGGVVEFLIFQPGILASFVVGWLLALRRAGGPIGWLLLGNWLVLMVSGFASTYAGYAYGNDHELPGARCGDLGHPRLVVDLRSARGDRFRDAGRPFAVAALQNR